MGKIWRTLFSGFDGILFGAMMCLTIFGLVTMYSPIEENIYFNRQIIWVLVVMVVFFFGDYTQLSFFTYRKYYILFLFIHNSTSTSSIIFWRNDIGCQTAF
jgi:cell division protein FtsW (lipid II flippase)